MPWTDEDWQAYAERPGLETWSGYVQGTPAGYFELARQGVAQVEVAMFGLLPHFIGRGVGGVLLTAALQRAWKEGTRRVWLHTESSDHPARVGQLPGPWDARLQDRDGVSGLPSIIKIQDT